MSAHPQLAASPDDIDYWTHSDWWPVWLVLERWGWPEPQRLEAKRQALLSACERGQVLWRRSDGKTYDDCAGEKIQNDTKPVVCFPQTRLRRPCPEPPRRLKRHPAYAR